MTWSTAATLGMNRKLYDTISLSFKIHVQNPPKTDEETIKVPQPPILKKLKFLKPTPVAAASTPINADDITCLGDKTLWTTKTVDNTTDTSSPPPPQTAPEPPTRPSNNDNEDVTECPKHLL